MKRLLILEDDIDFRRSLAQEFEELDYKVTEVFSINEIPNITFDFAIVDLRLKGEMGLNSIPVIHKISPECRIVVLTGYGSISSAVAAMKEGAINYLIKPTSVELIELSFKGLDSTSKVNSLEMPKLSEVENQYIDFVLCQNKGNISRTAKILGLHRQSLQRKLKKYP
jgi:two-component system response regulator RegA